MVRYSLRFHPTKMVLVILKKPHKVRCHKSYQNQYVYTDYLENQFMVDVKWSLLRVDPVQAGSYIYLYFPKPHFLSISRSSIATVSFESRTAILTLLFGKKRVELFKEKKHGLHIIRKIINLNIVFLYLEVALYKELL